MQRLLRYQKKKILLWILVVILGLDVCVGRLVYLMIGKSDYYETLAEDLHERERSIKAARGRILDRNGRVLASNRSVCTISVIHNQIEDPEAVIRMLSKELGMEEDTLRCRVEKVSSIERIKTNVSKEIGDRILACDLAGVKVDGDYKRYYPYGDLASKVLGFTGSDNQGIIGLEVKYDEYLKGTEGKILTMTDVRGVEVTELGEKRADPLDGNDLVISIDHNIQAYCQQAAEKVMEEKQAEAVSVILMDPDNGEILAMADVPEFDLNDPFTLTEGYLLEDYESESEACNQMWRNRCINDSYEPGSTFKIITAAAALEEDLVSVQEQFYCPGYITVEDRRIRCHKVAGHGSQTFAEGIMNSCNPVFIDLGLRLGTERMCGYFRQFGLLSKTGIDLPGEASTIMHKEGDMGQVELATVAFGQSFQITPIQLLTTVSSIINGGKRVTPHLGLYVQDPSGRVIETFSREEETGIVSEETGQTMRELLEQVVEEGTGNKAFLQGYSIGGKTATSQTLPRSSQRYIASFIGFAPAADPKVIGLIVIHDPEGIYYGGTVAAPVMAEIFENILPYLGVEMTNTEKEPQEVAN